MQEKLLKNGTVGLMVFSYKAPLTLAATFESYRQSGLLEMMDDICIFFIGEHKDDISVASMYNARHVVCDEEKGFMGAVELLAQFIQTDYVLWAEHDCKVWSRLTPGRLYRQLSEALGVLERDSADLVRLRHSWLGNPHVNAAALYSYYYEIQQLSSRWRNSEKLSDAPSWVKWMRRMANPLRSRRWIGRSVYVEENPHLIFPKYIHKDGSIFIVDSAVFQWSNQPSLFSRDFLLRGTRKLKDISAAAHSEQSTPGGFSKALNTSAWRKAHYRVGVAPGIFTWTSVSGYCS